MKVLRYDWIGAHREGYTGHPQNVMQSLGYKVLQYEAVGIADCSMICVEDIIYPLPHFLQVVDYPFSKKLDVCPGTRVDAQVYTWPSSLAYTPKPSDIPTLLLKQVLQEAIENEYYEEAAKIRDEILQRNLNTTSTRV
jgi:hypothetical protein